ncbi:leucine-rich repeats and immunoglobulin-like domains protein 3 [Schistocerca cancellata]|uniref:leucine-rich repeats and immunoglobulin-like domains protein 3 n=1 Tax=Schistocerca cancellata TaxID=274614 RepID=UPI002118BFB0|nr:leucine-rich repeats and immunoglobulin-like domains protein 3 [Schistocerca cancellata]
MANLILLFTCHIMFTVIQLEASNNDPCSSSCSCLGRFIDCSRKKLQHIPADLPTWTEELNLNKNYLTEIPVVDAQLNLTTLSLAHNQIRKIDANALHNLPTLKSLDVSYNNIREVTLESFPDNSSIEIINLSSNKISDIEEGTFEKLSALHELKINRNHLTGSVKELFKNLVNLKVLELNRNNITEIEGLSFEGSNKLSVLKLRRNFISMLGDGAFFKLENLHTLYLDFNNISAIRKGWLYGLVLLNHLNLSNNQISAIEADGWQFCQQLTVMDLSQNRLQAVTKGMFEQLTRLQVLRLNGNIIEYIADGAFDGLISLEVLELSSNRIAWTVEDDYIDGVYSSLRQLTELSLCSNEIKTINKKAFIGLDRITRLDLRNNSIVSIQENSFSALQHLKEVRMNTSDMLCDCKMKWFAIWLKQFSVNKSVMAVCAFPERLRGVPVLQVSINDFTCDEFPKPNIIESPQSLVALKGDNITLHCKASSSSLHPMAFHWKKDNVNLNAASTKQTAKSLGDKGCEQTSELVIFNISLRETGRYQCVVSNNFGSTYSNKSRITVLAFPSFTKIPTDVTTKAGSTARLECAATGLPLPEIVWQKDGGNDFPAARERRMHVMPTDDVFFIVNVKASDMGVYTCTAKNTAGFIVANATLSVLEPPSFVKPMESKEITAGDPIVIECMASGSPKPKLVWKKDGGNLITTERHFFTAEDQLLVIVNTIPSDAGTYECEMSNTLGTERGYSKLTVVPASAVGVTDGDITGIIIITVVCCAVGTSVIWVVIIYHTRKRMGLMEAGNDACPYPSTLLRSHPDCRGSVPNLYIDVTSEQSSDKDSGTGDSAKRSSDDFLLENGHAVALEEVSEHESVTNSLLPNCAIQGMSGALLLHSLLHRTDHDRPQDSKEVSANSSQRWSAPFGRESTAADVPHSCSYRSLPLDIQTHTEDTVGGDSQ